MNTKEVRLVIIGTVDEDADPAELKKRAEEAFFGWNPTVIVKEML